MHREVRQLPVYALVLDKPGQLGPWLQPHSDDAPCPTDPGPPSSAQRSISPVPTFPLTVVACGGIQQIAPNVPGHLALGALKVTMERVTNQLPGDGDVDRPVIDNTGLAGTFDLLMEFAPQGGTGDSNVNGWRQPGPTFAEALREQLGLRLEPETRPVEVFVLDHIEEPSAN